MTLLFAAALAFEPPELPDGTPPPVTVQVEGEAWAALHPELLRWRIARSAYADQLEVERLRLRGLLEAGELTLSATTRERDAALMERDAYLRRLEEWDTYADRIERREKRGTVRDAVLIGGTVAAVLGVGLVVAQLR